MTATRTLAVGDRVQARPCVVTITKITTHNVFGYCAHCADTHVIERRRYEAGHGPWQPTGSAK